MALTGSVPPSFTPNVVNIAQNTNEVPPAEDEEWPEGASRNKWLDRCTMIKGFFIDNQYLVFIAIAFLVSLTAPSIGVAISEPWMNLGIAGKQVRIVSFINVVVVFLISGLRLDTEATLLVIRSPLGLFCAIALILFITPFVGFATAQFPFGNAAFNVGLTVFASTPTTLASGASMVASCPGTERAKELALVIVAVTNMLGCFTTPLFLNMTLHDVGNGQINSAQVVVGLIYQLLIPLLVGKLIREMVPGAKSFSKDYKVALGMFMNFNVIFVTFQSLSQAQHQIMKLDPVIIFEIFVAGALHHVVLWVINLPMLFFKCVPHEHHRRAVWFLASEKTLPVSIAIINSLSDDVDKGLASIPPLFAFVFQLIIDSFLIGRWTVHFRAKEALKNISFQVIPEQARPRAMITAAITGHRTTREMAKRLPVLCKEQVRDSVECVQAGASIIHLHVCEEDEHQVVSTVAAARYAQVIAAIRSELPNVIIEITCRGIQPQNAFSFDVEKGNLVFVDPSMWNYDEKLRPEIVALNMSTRNIDDRTVIVNPIYVVEQQIMQIYECGCVPRCDVYDVGDILVAGKLLKKGVLKSPVNFLLILGSYSGIGQDKEDLEYMVRHLPPDSIWTALGTGRFNFPVAEYCCELGGHLRTGFEDCTFISKGVKADSNAQLVEKVAEIAKNNGIEPATVLQARDIMGFPKKVPEEENRPAGLGGLSFGNSFRLRRAQSASDSRAPLVSQSGARSWPQEAGGSKV